MNENELKTAALYIRVSTDKQEELSPDSQKRLLLDYAKSHHMIVPPEFIYIESGISGRRADKRPKFQQMISTAKSDSHPFDVILLWKFSRFARNQEESIVYKSMLRNKCHVDVVSISEPLIDGPFGGLIERIIEWMDEFYSIRLSGDVIRGMTENAMRGSYQCRPPLGYRIPYHKATPEIVPEEAEIVRLIFHKYADEKMSIFAITKYLNSQGMKTSHGKPFEKRSVDYILQNPAYAGDIRWNRCNNTTKEVRDRSEWITGTGHHPAIISKELFEKAQARLQSEYTPRNAKPSEITRHWLSGLLKCPSCGRSLSSCVMHRKSMPDTFSFQCGGYLKGKCSHNCYVREESIAPAVLEALEQAIASGTVKYDIKQSLASSAPSEDEIQVLKRRLDKVGQKEKRARDAYIEGIDSKEDYKKIRELLNEERQELEDALHLLEASPQAGNNDAIMLNRISNVLDMLRSDEISIPEKNAALKSIVDKITYNKAENHIDVYYYMTKAPENLIE